MNLKYDNKSHTLRQVFYRYKFPVINKDFQSIDDFYQDLKDEFKEQDT